MLRSVRLINLRNDLLDLGRAAVQLARWRSREDEPRDRSDEWTDVGKRHSYGARGEGESRCERVDVIDVWTHLDTFSMCCQSQKDGPLHGMTHEKNISFEHDAVCVCVYKYIHKSK